MLLQIKTTNIVNVISGDSIVVWVFGYGTNGSRFNPRHWQKFIFHMLSLSFERNSLRKVTLAQVGRVVWLSEFRRRKWVFYVRQDPPTWALLEILPSGNLSVPHVKYINLNLIYYCFRTLGLSLSPLTFQRDVLRYIYFIIYFVLCISENAIILKFNVYTQYHSEG